MYVYWPRIKRQTICFSLTNLFQLSWEVSKVQFVPTVCRKRCAFTFLSSKNKVFCRKETVERLRQERVAEGFIIIIISSLSKISWPGERHGCIRTNPVQPRPAAPWAIHTLPPPHARLQHAVLQWVQTSSHF